MFSNAVHLAESWGPASLARLPVSEFWFCHLVAGGLCTSYLEPLFPHPEPWDNQNTCPIASLEELEKATHVKYLAQNPVQNKLRSSATIMSQLLLAAITLPQRIPLFSLFCFLRNFISKANQFLLAFLFLEIFLSLCL